MYVSLEEHDALMRTHFGLFVEAAFSLMHPGKTFRANWHIDLMADNMEALARGDIQHLILNVPPRHLKSFVVTICYVAWVLGHDPTKHIICLSYSGELADNHARKCRDLMETPFYKRLFPRTRISDKRYAVHDFETTRGGSRLATSVGGTLTGRGGSLIIADDPIKPEDAYSEAIRKRTNEYFGSTVWSRLDNKEEDNLLLVMQRLHTDDPIAYLLDHDPTIRHVSIPAIAAKDENWDLSNGRRITRKAGEVIDPSRESKDTLDKTKSRMGTHAFSAQYLQQPIPVEGHIIKLKWFERYQTMPSPQGDDYIVQSWDTAVKPGELNDYSVCTTWLVRDRTFYLIDVFRDKLETPDLKRKIIQMENLYNARHILIEDASSGSHLIPELKRESVYPIGIKPEGDKVMRLAAVAPKVEEGRVFIPLVAPWLEDFEAEFLAFPNGRHDDQVDSVSQFLNWIDQDRGFFGMIPMGGL